MPDTQVLAGPGWAEPMAPSLAVPPHRAVTRGEGHTRQPHSTSPPHRSHAGVQALPCGFLGMCFQPNVHDSVSHSLSYDRQIFLMSESVFGNRFLQTDSHLTGFHTSWQSFYAVILPLLSSSLGFMSHWAGITLIFQEGSVNRTVLNSATSVHQMTHILLVRTLYSPIFPLKHWEILSHYILTLNV